MVNKYVFIITVIILFLTACTTSKDIEMPLTPKVCGIEQCHGLDITCGEDEIEVCTGEYKLGDFCRKFIGCDFIDNRCSIISLQEFKECKTCVETCEGIETSVEAFECEEICREKFP